MKLPCPLCGESIVYQAEKAGSTIPCIYCKRPLRMPAPKELDPESYEQYTLEVKRERERQVRLQQKEEARRKREAEAHRKREAQAKQRAAAEEWNSEMQQAAARAEAEEREPARREQEEQAEREKAAAEAKAIDAVKSPVAEESAPDVEYPGMRTIAGFYQFAARVGVLLAVLAFFGGLVAAADANSAAPMLIGIGATVVSLFLALLCWAAAESIAIVLDVARDLRIIRYLCSSGCRPPGEDFNRRRPGG